MEITLSALLEGKPTIIREKEYFATKEYVQPFIDEMSKFTKDFIINVQLPGQITVSNNNKDLTYNKVWIQAIMPDQCTIDGYVETYGLVYAIDARVPVYKVYRAYINKETHNMCVFNPEWLQVYEMKPGEKLVYSIKELMEKPFDIKQRLKVMKNTFISADIEDTHKLLGKLINRSLQYEYCNVGGKIKISSADVVKTFEDVYLDSTSHYYVQPTVEGSLHNYYGALCSQITKSKDIINRFEKTILVGMLFDLVEYETSN